jgi:hypothetical protein
MNSALQEKTVGALSQILSKGVVRHAEQAIGRVNFRATGVKLGAWIDRPWFTRLPSSPLTGQTSPNGCGGVDGVR